ncbi:helicase [Oryctes borbonicus]|uniref:Helicase n=1 Tax=Oryctes borbonicus TaxID=1629725 RepID=A0A0T6B8D4_9SCAR|nr:helicase [Oryctes borbonicus]
MADETDFVPRNYQVELMQIAINNNTIIYLPTGAGKTYIAVLVLKHLSGALIKPWNEGRKVTIILVNTIALVHQHGKYLKRHTPFSVGEYTGELNVDFWDKNVWYKQCEDYQILIMTCQILTSAVERQVLDLNRVNLLIFDECHRGVNDQPMRQLMKNFQHIDEQPRVLGLTATLLNGNCAPSRVKDMVQNLEITYHSKVATVDELKDVLGYATNPSESILCYSTNVLTRHEEEAITFLEDSADILRVVVLDSEETSPPRNLVHLDPVKGQKDLANLLTDAVIHIKMLGTYGGLQAIVAHTIQIECMKKFCDDENFYHILNSAITSLTYAKRLLSKQLSGDKTKDVYKFSSPKVLSLFRILQEYSKNHTEELCAIIFVQRRFTAKILYHLLVILAENVSDFSFLKPNFIVGYNTNPYNDTRESLYYTKVNREIIQGFFSKEYNILISSNVLEEGIDIPTCTLVVKFDEPVDYRSYIQSKGRARHGESLYYMMVEQKDYARYSQKYHSFQEIEAQLNEYLIGQNGIRKGPNEDHIMELYNEDPLRPYYVNGPGSAHVTMTAAVSLLSSYCNSLEGDVYTTYAPNWYAEKKDKALSVVIELPIVCPYIDPIQGEFMGSKKQAKRAAALKACKILHQIGELDDNLRPVKRTELVEETEFLFKHWPAIKEQSAGNKKNLRLHKIHVPSCCIGRIIPGNPVYLYIINLTPNFDLSNMWASALSDLYSANLCFGIISPNKFPRVCTFPLYVKFGEIKVNICTDAKTVDIDAENLKEIQHFNYLVYNDILGLLKNFLIVNKEDANFIVPVDKDRKEINFELIRQHKQLRDRFREPPLKERLALEVTETTFLNKIVTPWYRKDDTEYLVTNICYDLNSHSPFPSNYPDYISYYKCHYQRTIFKQDDPLVRVEALSSRMNYLKPRSHSDKKNKEPFLNYTIYLVPELVVVQDFPASLWLQAKLLPSVFDKLLQLFRAEELRVDIANTTGIDAGCNRNWKSLQLDEYLIDYEIDPTLIEMTETEENVEVLKMENILSLTHILNKEVVSNTLQEEYPWEKSEEPVDMERNLDVTLMDIEYYLNFMNKPVTAVARQIRNPPIKQKPAITYTVDFKPINIEMLNIINKKGPELADIFKALATAKCKDIVNLERLETLGDSFLKYITSLFIFLQYPKYNEGHTTALKGRLVSNKNLYYLAENKKLGSFLKYFHLNPREDWCPPGFCLPTPLRTRCVDTTALLTISIPDWEQKSGILSNDTINVIQKRIEENAASEETYNHSINYYLGEHQVSDKFVSDVVESLLGVYLQSCGIPGAIKLVEWLQIIPGVNLLELFSQPPPNPILNPHSTQKNVDFLLPTYEDLERNLGYKFNNRAYLLQALTHSSYTPNRITKSYQRLEFLGDAVLDFLITMHIYETGKHLNPGNLTDLRSALVNNITFACFTVRCGFHKHLLAINSKLQSYIDRFIKYQENKNFVVNDDVLILLNEDDYHIAEYLDVPKVLGDIFESLAGAVFLDSDMNLKVVWDVFYRIMWKEINEFRTNIPKNAIRMLYETAGAHPIFHKAVETEEGKIMVKLDFMINGSKKRVHGFGDNKSIAKRAAAKMALRLLGR